MKHTIAEIKKGAQVWMYLPDLHASRPLLVTVGSTVSDFMYLMPFRYITVQERDGMCGDPNFLTNRTCSACSECYDTEEEAQEVINREIKRAEEEKAKLKDFYCKVAEEYFDRNVHCDTEEQAFYFKAGFVDACMELRNKEHLLKVNPPVKGITESSTNKNLWDRFMKENNEF